MNVPLCTDLNIYVLDHISITPHFGPREGWVALRLLDSEMSDGWLLDEDTETPAPWQVVPWEAQTLPPLSKSPGGLFLLTLHCTERGSKTRLWTSKQASLSLFNQCQRDFCFVLFCLRYPQICCGLCSERLTWFEMKKAKFLFLPLFY